MAKAYLGDFVENKYKMSEVLSCYMLAQHLGLKVAVVIKDMRGPDIKVLVHSHEGLGQNQDSLLLTR
ncbi:hypothetical protein MHLNE_22770 [Moorella humiferrea]